MFIGLHVNSLYFSISPQMELSEQDTSTSQYMRYKSIESKYMGKPTDTIYFQKHLIIHNQDIFDCNLQFLRSTYWIWMFYRLYFRSPW